MSIFKDLFSVGGAFWDNMSVSVLSSTPAPGPEGKRPLLVVCGFGKVRTADPKNGGPRYASSGAHRWKRRRAGVRALRYQPKPSLLHGQSRHAADGSVRGGNGDGSGGDSQAHSVIAPIIGNLRHGRIRRTPGHRGKLLRTAV